MRANIYQVISEKDTNKTKFRDFQHATSYGEIDPSIYRCVFRGSIKGEDLEDVYEAFNVFSPYISSHLLGSKIMFLNPTESQ